MAWTEPVVLMLIDVRRADFDSAARRKVFVKLQEFWVVTDRGILGPSGYHVCVQGVRVHGRLVEWTAERRTWEADPRHAELIRKSFGVTGRSVTTPGLRDKQAQ